jgi:hypothetical protein
MLPAMVVESTGSAACGAHTSMGYPVGIHQHVMKSPCCTRVAIIARVSHSVVVAVCSGSWTYH